MEKIKCGHIGKFAFIYGRFTSVRPIERIAIHYNLKRIFEFDLIPFRKAFRSITTGSFSFQYLHRNGHRYDVRVCLKNRTVKYMDVTTYYNGESYKVVEFFRKEPSYIIPKFYADYSPTGQWFTNYSESTFFNRIHITNNMLDC